MVDRARQQAHDYAIANDYDYILWWDDDIVAPENVISRLLLRGVDLVGAMAFKRTEPYGMFAYTCVNKDYADMSKYHHVPINFKNKGLLEVDAVGTGCMLMRTEVIKPLTRPWWVWPTEGSEDIALCARLREISKKVYVDTDIEVGHLEFTPKVIDSAVHEEWCAHMGQWVKDNPQIKNHKDFSQLKEMIDGAKRLQ
jgi:hypothetical protein